MPENKTSNQQRYLRATEVLNTLLSDVRTLKAEQLEGTYLLWALHELEGKIMNIIEGRPRFIEDKPPLVG